jgi:zinc and cadmium transporter
MRLSYIIIFSLLGSVGALTGAGLLLAFPKSYYQFKIPFLAYAVGTLLGSTFIGLLPEAIEQGRPESVCLAALAGIFIFFFLEKILRLPHRHGHADQQGDHLGRHHEVHPAGTLILIGDTFHNFVDGVVIATAFSSSVPLGMLTSLAVIAHEIPQELSDFVILLQSRWSSRRAYWMNFLSSLGTPTGAMLGYISLQIIAPNLPFVLAVAAASFLYVAMADLAPILHHEAGFRRSLVQFAGLLLGAGTIFLLNVILG